MNNIEIKTDVPPLVIVDLRVSVFSILGSIKPNREYLEEEDFYLYWITLFNNPLFDLNISGIQVAVVDDIKYKGGNYWRDSYLKKKNKDFPTYKGGRPEKPEDYWKILEAGRSFIKDNNIPYLSHKGFEADDFAGAFTNTVLQEGYKRDIIFYTIDSDWGQLINDELGIYFYYSSFPCWKGKRLRNEAVIKEWFLDRQNIELENVRDIVKVKSEDGDKSDNLPPGSPPEVIDLLNPGKKLPKEKLKMIKYIYENPYVNTSKKEAVEAKNFLNKVIISRIIENEYV